MFGFECVSLPNLFIVLLFVDPIVSFCFLCYQGNSSRFINHSCEPNCETQKWLARGELAIGLFAIRDIAAGTELNFDYNFERYGDKPMRCYCKR